MLLREPEQELRMWKKFNNNLISYKTRVILIIELDFFVGDQKKADHDGGKYRFVLMAKENQYE